MMLAVRWHGGMNMKQSGLIISILPEAVHGMSITSDQLQIDVTHLSPPPEDWWTWRDLIVFTVTLAIVLLTHFLHRKYQDIIDGQQSNKYEWLCRKCGRYNFSSQFGCLGCKAQKTEDAPRYLRNRQYLLTHVYENILQNRMTNGKYSGQTFQTAMEDVEYRHWLLARRKSFSTKDSSLATLVNLSQFETWALETLYRIEYDSFRAEEVFDDMLLDKMKGNNGTTRNMKSTSESTPG